MWMLEIIFVSMHIWCRTTSQGKGWGTLERWVLIKGGTVNEEMRKWNGNGR